MCCKHRDLRRLDNLHRFGLITRRCKNQRYRGRQRSLAAVGVWLAVRYLRLPNRLQVARMGNQAAGPSSSESGVEKSRTLIEAKISGQGLKESGSAKITTDRDQIRRNLRSANLRQDRAKPRGVLPKGISFEGDSSRKFWQQMQSKFARRHETRPAF